MIFSKTFLRMKRWNEDIFCLGRKFLQSSSGLKKIVFALERKKLGRISLMKKIPSCFAFFLVGGIKLDATNVAEVPKKSHVLVWLGVIPTDPWD